VENSNTNLEEARQTEENNNQELVFSESYSESEDQDKSSSPVTGYIFGFFPENDPESENQASGKCRWITIEEEEWEYF
jgi:hypothetical protein